MRVTRLAGTIELFELEDANGNLFAPNPERVDGACQVLADGERARVGSTRAGGRRSTRQDSCHRSATPPRLEAFW